MPMPVAVMRWMSAVSSLTVGRSISARCSLDSSIRWQPTEQPQQGLLSQGFHQTFEPREREHPDFRLQIAAKAQQAQGPGHTLEERPFQPGVRPIRSGRMYAGALEQRQRRGLVGDDGHELDR